MMKTGEAVQAAFPLLYEPELLREIEECGRIRQLPEGTVLMEIGSYVREVPLVLDGLVKISREDESANELFLYYLHAGETCAMSLSCCVAHKPSEIRAIVEEECKLVSIPVEKMDEWINRFRSWKSFVMQTYSLRFEELLATIDGIAFRKMDERLLKYLEDAASSTGSPSLSITHQHIARDLNSSREVISRLLKQLERMGKIRLGRNRIELTAPV